MTDVYLIRHSMFDRRMVSTKNEMLPLTKKGEIFAKKRLDIPELKNIDVLFSSEFLRARSTAKYISNYNNDLRINVTSLVNERAKGNTENVPPSFWDEQLRNENAKTEGGESRKEVSSRMLLFIDNILNENKGKRIAAVSHSVAITYLLMNYCELIAFDHRSKYRCLRYKDKNIIEGIINFCDIFKLTFDDNNNLTNIDKI